jgi:hypothetical protein
MKKPGERSPGRGILAFKGSRGSRRDAYLVTYEATVTVSEAVEDPSTVYVPVPTPWQMKFTCPGADVKNGLPPKSISSLEPVLLVRMKVLWFALHFVLLLALACNVFELNFNAPLAFILRLMLGPVAAPAGSDVSPSNPTEPTTETAKIRLIMSKYPFAKLVHYLCSKRPPEML